MRLFRIVACTNTISITVERVNPGLIVTIWVDCGTRGTRTLRNPLEVLRSSKPTLELLFGFCLKSSEVLGRQAVVAVA